jgi:hypothetical protein
MQQYQDLKFNPFKIRHYTILVRFGLLGHRQVLEIQGNYCAFHATAIGVFVFTVFLK